jgi:AcrR family transcriptional regulator
MVSGTAVAAASARDRLLVAADELFYEEGIHTVGIDRIIEKAGVAKATLYSVFGSKEELIRAYLRSRLEGRQRRINAALSGLDSPRERILAVFDVLGSYFAEDDFHGCAFLNASAESQPGSAAFEESLTSRAWTRALFTDLARQAGASDPDALARQLRLVYDGAMTSARMDGVAGVANAARTAAAALIDAAAR